MVANKLVGPKQRFVHAKGSCLKSHYDMMKLYFCLGYESERLGPRMPGKMMQNRTSSNKHIDFLRIQNANYIVLQKGR